MDALTSEQLKKIMPTAKTANIVKIKTLFQRRNTAG